MIVYLPRWSRYGTFAALALAITACDAPDEYSDLRPDGPPEVLTVSVNALDTRATSGGDGATIEQATFCKTQAPNDGAAGAGDPKRPDQVNTVDLVPLVVCPEDLTKGVDERTDAMPEAWYARVEFDELLDPSIEDLVANIDPTTMEPDGTYTGTLKNTQPGILKCDSVTGSGQVDVPYDGYYSPAGNSISYPLGPSLVFIPNDPTLVATSSECTLTLKENITDKDGNQVPADQRGPYKFRIGAITVLAIDPTSADAAQDPIAAGVDITFNTAVTKASLNAVDGAGDSSVFAFSPAVADPYVAEESPEEWFFGADFPAGGGPYTFSFLSGAKLIDQCGKSQTLGAPSVDDQTQSVPFTTNALKLNGLTGAAEPGAKVAIAFNQYMDPSSLLASEITVTPTLANFRVEPSGDLTKLLVYGDYQMGTAYTVTLKNGATIDDCPGAEYVTTTDPISCGVAKSATYTSPMDQVAMFTTASAIVLKSISLKDNATESVAASAAGITLTFNQEMDPTTLVQGTDFTISPNIPLGVINLGGPGGGGTYEQLNIAPTSAAGTFPAGTYTFTLLGTAKVNDLIGTTGADVFSATADTVIHFTVTANPGPAATCL